MLFRTLIITFDVKEMRKFCKCAEASSFNSPSIDVFNVITRASYSKNVAMQTFLLKIIKKNKFFVLFRTLIMTFDVKETRKFCKYVEESSFNSPSIDAFNVIMCASYHKNVAMQTFWLKIFMNVRIAMFS